MPINVLMPPLSQTMDSLVLVEWAKKVGEPVTKGETLFLVESDKANLEVESPGTGILHQILAEPGSEVKVKTRIAVILAPGEAPEEGPPRGIGIQAEQTSVPAPGFQAQISASGAMDELPPERRNRIFASPRARGLAQREAVPLAEVKATGPQAMIVERDVRGYLEQQKARPRVTPLARRIAEAQGLDLSVVKPAAGERITRAEVEVALGERVPIGPEPVVVLPPAVAPAVVPEAAAAEMPIPAPPQVAPGKSRRVGLSNLRKTIGRRMQASHQSTAAVTLTRKVDATELKLLRDRILKDLAEGDVHPTYTDFLVKIVGRCLGHHPQLNAHFSDGEALELYDEVHMGLAVDTERGLLVPVIRDAGHKGLLELAADRASLVRRTLEGSITPDELSGGTFTITNLGPLGVDAFTPIINPPQVAILGVGRIHPEPAAYEGQIALREMMFLSLTFDHRAVDGAPAARLLQDIAQLIEKPHLMWL